MLRRNIAHGVEPRKEFASTVRDEPTKTNDAYRGCCSKASNFQLPPSTFHLPQIEMGLARALRTTATTDKESKTHMAQIQYSTV
jgi:hypothetical protein